MGALSKRLFGEGRLGTCSRTSEEEKRAPSSDETPPYFFFGRMRQRSSPQHIKSTTQVRDVLPMALPVSLCIIMLESRPVYIALHAALSLCCLRTGCDLERCDLTVWRTRHDMIVFSAM